MAKDPAFLFYDGDAARDVSHLNRLGRGCYFDLIQAQRKFGRMSEETIKTILGKDFDSCWNQVKMCLSYEEHMYFIDWLENSTIKRKAYSESRSKNRSSLKSDSYKKDMKTYDIHMENANENIIDYNTLTNYYKSPIIKFLIEDLKENKEITSIDEIKNLEMVVVEMNNIWAKVKPDYCFDKLSDYSALLRIAYLIAEKKGIRKYDAVHLKQTEITESFQKIATFIAKTDNKFFKKLTLSGICIRKNFQSIEEEMRNLLIPEKNEALEKKRVHQEDYFENQ